MLSDDPTREFNDDELHARALITTSDQHEFFLINNQDSKVPHRDVVVPRVKAWLDALWNEDQVFYCLNEACGAEFSMGVQELAPAFLVKMSLATGEIELFPVCKTCIEHENFADIIRDFIRQSWPSETGLRLIERATVQ